MSFKKTVEILSKINKIDKNGLKIANYNIFKCLLRNQRSGVRIP